MKDIFISSGWSKQNLVTIVKGEKTYDVYRHESGIVGKRYGLSPFLTITERDFKIYIKNVATPKKGKIKIVHCNAFGTQFANVTPCSVHTVVEPPLGYHNDSTGVWIMGVGEKVRVLPAEFIIYNDE